MVPKNNEKAKVEERIDQHLESNKDWTLVPKTTNYTISGIKWISQNKMDILGKKKARLVVQNFYQEKSIDFDFISLIPV